MCLACVDRLRHDRGQAQTLRFLDGIGRTCDELRRLRPDIDRSIGRCGRLIRSSDVLGSAKRDPLPTLRRTEATVPR